MTRDVIALTPAMPDPKTMLAGLYAGGPGLRVGTLADGAVVQLCTPSGRPLVSIEVPLLVQVSGEAERLLGDDVPVPDGPFWWTEARASTAIEEAARLAGSFAGRVATVLGGTVWPPQDVHTDVIELPDELPGADQAPPPALDMLTDKAAVVIQDRPVIAMTSWMSEALRIAATSDRALQIVTPSHARLSLATRTALQGHPNRWVVQDPGKGGYYDGLSGAVLHWQGGQFAPVRGDDGVAQAADAFKPTADSGERQLILSVRTRHPAEENLVLGGAVETAFQHLTGAPPAGWSTAEPVNLPWSRRQVTALARRRAPQPTWLIVTGIPSRPALATIRVSRTQAGVEEDITLAVGFGPDEPPMIETVALLAEDLAAEYGLVSMLASLRAAHRDLMVPPRWETPPVPLAFTLGPESAREMGLSHARRPPLDVTPVELGAAASPALHYPLGDGSDPSAWQGLEELMRHLRAA
ncbi:DUF6177 family protein [Streptomyces longispororuber]|uniref:DUF6177 family protein n=1 Tax=Streptomyces longispororuber TaxID=68230 RepID=UPI0033C63CF4